MFSSTTPHLSFPRIWLPSLAGTAFSPAGGFYGHRGGLAHDTFDTPFFWVFFCSRSFIQETKHMPPKPRNWMMLNGHKIGVKQQLRHVDSLWFWEKSETNYHSSYSDLLCIGKSDVTSSWYSFQNLRMYHQAFLHPSSMITSNINTSKISKAFWKAWKLRQVSSLPAVA